MLYQTQHSVLGDKATLESGSDLSFPIHIHNSFEVIIATEGEIEVTVGGNKYIAAGNRCVLVFPNQLHEIETPRHSKHAILIFSPQLVRAFSKRFEANVPKSNSFLLDSFYINKIVELKGNKSTVGLKGLLYSVCDEFDKNAEYTEFTGDGQNLLFKIFSFVSENYKGNCSLYELANQTAYNYVYLSKHFSKNTGISYTEYVCRFRINEACYLLTNTSNTMIDVAYESGFDCLRSFNRSFKSILGISPSEYRKKALIHDSAKNDSI
ncbi:MAG: helix-turn-helix transcriptional regulator [Clostridia bacterium]|nr:helix-turn-helix transcriptional regulator [Clostridia bacterium]